ncbi:hypothetical protein SELMODRAFT_447419 [Selaginella moellendorffii]|uniref:Protein YIP n=1 Tax=Selaginella moellendorffii TaxID=88036 RepID=D8SZA3_SELML|nr:protein YIPF1 homolog isoform X1 [Selaginella moellendorffii]EFJ10174.1 hypothetical protein SELMODRAFT_447419 [Selaginella moellendorffii]|eukprot:XP_002988663.1 protein YIPF1 homolog isoform X1 [Selaginella moellendorffii]
MSGYSTIGGDVSGSVPAAAGADHVALQFQDSNLQTFPPTDARGKLTGSSKPPRDADDTFSRPAEPEQFGWHGYFNLLSYRPYFNVDTSDVVQRVGDSLVPFKGDFVEKTATNPDMYGPFWICTTLIFVTAALGNFAAYLAHKTSSAGDTNWHYDINKVSWSAGLFYGYVGLLPLGLYFVLKYLGVATGLVQLWCLYGYSLFIFIPTSFLSVVPVEKFKWAVVAAAAGLSATFLALNLRTHIKTASERWFLIVCGCFVLQLGLGLLMKLYFFTVQFS